MTSVIRAEALTKSYGTLNAVDNLNLSVAKGTIFSLLGPNGAGKTTTVEILEGLRTPTTGSARVLDHDVTSDYGPIRRRVGTLPQDFEPFDRLTPMEAVGYWASLFNRKVTKQDVRKLLEVVELEDRRNLQALKLSGGEKRKLGIAMAMIGQPELLFLDEPTTGLDPKARRDLWALVKDLKREGRTVFLTTHYLEEAEQLADDVGIMNGGKLVVEGQPEDLIAKSTAQTTIVLEGAGEEGLSEVTRAGISGRLQDGNVLVKVPDPSEMKKYLAHLSTLDISLTDMYTRRASLEDVFMQLVGARMEEGVLQ